MANTSSLGPIYLMMEHNPTERRTVATFPWASYQTKDSYTIARGDISFKLDGHVPVRPTEVIWREGMQVGEEQILSELFGDPFAASMVEVRNKEGAAIISYTFERTHRLAIAQMQLQSPSTPFPLAMLIDVMVDELAVPH